jgi:hypothetical protein
MAAKSGDLGKVGTPFLAQEGNTTTEAAEHVDGDDILPLGLLILMVILFHWT